MHYEASLVVKAPRSKVYSAYTDFAAPPRWSKQKDVVRASRTEGNAVYLERGGASGENRKSVRVMKLFPPERVESESETRSNRTRSLVKFEEAAEGTKVTASLDVKTKGHWALMMKPRGKAEVEPSALEEPTSFAKYVEGLPWMGLQFLEEDPRASQSARIGREAGVYTMKMVQEMQRRRLLIGLRWLFYYTRRVEPEGC